MDGFWWDRFWGQMTGLVPLFFCLLCIPKLKNLQNLDLEVWALRGIVTILILCFASTQIANVPYLSRFTGSVMVWIFIALVTTCVIDFPSPKRCRPKRKITNVSAIMPPESEIEIDPTLPPRP